MTQHRESIMAAYSAAIDAARPAAAFDRYCQRDGNRILVGDDEGLDLESDTRIWLVGAGKASYSLGAAAFRMLGDHVAGGSIALRDPSGPPIPRVSLWQAGHPHPNTASVMAADDALRIVGACGPKDIVLCLLSGGASSLWAAPPDGISLSELRTLTAALLRSGAPIGELNTIRKHVSRISGGRLSRACNAARLLTIAISDVVDATADVIGSGPTLPPGSSHADALAIIRKRGIEAPTSILRHLHAAVASKESSMWDGAVLDCPLTSFHVIASVNEAVDGAARSLASRGFAVTVMDRAFRGEARRIASEVVDAAIAVPQKGRPAALIWGGESTVTVTGTGSGGRNQELALAAALCLQDHEGITVASLATDGSDGPTPAAGAFADSETVRRGIGVGLDAELALRDNDSHTFLTAAGDTFVSGPTGTNVNDLVLAIID